MYAHETSPAMTDDRYITLKVQYDRAPRYGRSLAWIAPELKDSSLRLTEDRLDEPMPSRTWSGTVGRRDFERLVDAWLLPEDLGEPPPADSRHAVEPDTHTYTFDGMNWERGGESPIVYVALEVRRDPRAITQTR